MHSYNTFINKKVHGLNLFDKIINTNYHPKPGGIADLRVLRTQLLGNFISKPSTV